MIARPPTLRERIDEVESRIGQRQARVQVSWRETQHATRSLVRAHRTIPIVVAAGAAVLAGILLLRRSPAPRDGASGGRPGGMLGVLVAAGLTLIAPRYSSLFPFAWQLLRRRIASARTGAARKG
jgi:hypothetical protein